LLVAAALVALAPFGATAQPYPSQDIHIICAVPAGSGADVLVRHFAEKLRPITGRNIIVENKIGALGNIAAEYTVRAKPDGYTIHIHSASVVTSNYSLIKNPPFNPAKDLAVAASTHIQPFMIIVPAASPYKTLAELTAAMKEKGEKASYSHSNATGKVMGELYKAATGITAVDVPYRIAPDSFNDLASGRLDYGMMDPVTAISQAKAGKIRMLAVSTARRMEAVPELPTITEAGVPGVELNLWFAAMLPAATPRPILEQINGWFKQILVQEDTRKFLNGFGSDPWITSVDEAQAQFVKDQKDWEGFVKTAKIEPQG
jgi:tripartite-type tricarboxylate transporter receptor subunit TctC